MVVSALGAMMLMAGVGTAAEVYTVDRGHSQIGFSVRHFGVSNVRGEFLDYSADLTVNEKELATSNVTVRIQAASIDTRHEQRDGHLRSGDFLDVENHPEISFESRRIEADTASAYKAVRKLTIRGITREVELDLTVAEPLEDPLGNYRIGIEGSTLIDREDFGVSWSRVMDNGGLFVGDEVRITFSLEATRSLGE